MLIQGSLTLEKYGSQNSLYLALIMFPEIQALLTKSNIIDGYKNSTLYCYGMLYSLSLAAPLEYAKEAVLN